VESLFTVERYPTVLQMVSTVAANAPHATLHDILHALFPCGSITGAPKIRAMQIADELEGEPRHLYTGSIGHIRPGGDFSFSVAIRTLELAPDGRGRLGIGSGIVADSDPDLEYDECLAKARFATDLPVHFELIETLRIEPGQPTPCPLLPLHLERLRDTARHYGFPYEEALVRRALDDVVRKHASETLLRARMTLARSGRLEVRVVPFTDATVTPTVVIADRATDSGNPFLHRKTTVRGLYDETLQRIAALPQCFDALFFNERGELTEGARSNVYLVREGFWLTPPLECGALDGVMRRHLLETHAPRIRERVLRMDDLLSADEIYLSNALRGLFRVRLAGHLGDQTDPGSPA
jgi:para-aminobenzoate synthetase/4-amino-4-deoxychorismate lyase